MRDALVLAALLAMTPSAAPELRVIVSAADAQSGVPALARDALSVTLHEADGDDSDTACESDPVATGTVEEVSGGSAAPSFVATFTEAAGSLVACVRATGFVPAAAAVPAADVAERPLDLEVSLEPAVEIAGRVIAHESGEPLTAFEVQVLRLVEVGRRGVAESSPNGSRLTAAPNAPRHRLHERVAVESEDGTFRFDELPVGQWSLRVDAPGRLARMVGPVGSRGSVPGIPHDVGDLALRLGLAVVGTVVDAASGAPVEGARVEVAGGEVTATSDADGRFALAPLPEGLHWLSASHADHPTLREPVSARVRADQPPEERPVTIDLEAFGAVVVEAEDSDGVPLPELDVVVKPVSPSQATRHVTTGADGRALVESVRPGAVEVGTFDRTQRVEAHVVAAETTLVTLVLEGDVTVTGPIRRDGRPVRAIVWHADPTSPMGRLEGGDHARAATTYELHGVRPGPLSLQVSEIVEREGRDPYWMRHDHELVVPARVAIVHHAIDLPSAPETEPEPDRDESVVARGVLRHEQTREPLGGWFVSHAGGEPTASDGAFTARFRGDGTHSLRALASRLRQHERLGLAEAPPTRVVVANGELVEPREPIVVLARPGPLVRLRVLDAAGVPLAGAHLGFDVPGPIHGGLFLEHLPSTDVLGLASVHARREGPATLLVSHRDALLAHAVTVDVREGTSHEVRLPRTGALRITSSEPIELHLSPIAPPLTVRGTNWPAHVHREGGELVVRGVPAGLVVVVRRERSDEVLVRAGETVVLGP